MPTYDPLPWNDDGAVQENNNCYDYAVDQKTGNYSQPGRASGAQWTPPASCTGVGLAAVNDGLRPSSRSDTCPPGCWKVALAVMENGMDYHWYRQDDNGQWSHKPGQTRANRLFDSNNMPATNPETAERGLYSRFCGYYCVCPPIVVASLPKPSGDSVFAEVLIKGPTMLSSRDIELALPEGKLILMYRNLEAPMNIERPNDAVIVTALIFSGRQNPTWTLSDADINVIRDLITDLPGSKQEVNLMLGYSGFRLEAGAAIGDFPRSLNVLNGIITTTDANGETRSFKDTRGLEIWLVSAIHKSGMEKELHYVMTETFRRIS